MLKKTGISQSKLHRYLNGRMPNLESLIAIRDKCNINMNWIATGEGEMFSQRGNNEGITIGMPEISEIHPKIMKIIRLLKTMGKTDIEDFEKILEEKKKMRDMEYKILKMEEILRQKNANPSSLIFESRITRIFGIARKTDIEGFQNLQGSPFRRVYDFIWTRF